MQYLIMNYTPPANHALAARPETEADGPAWGAYTKALVEAGVLVGGEALFPSASAATLRIADGATDVQDGPYADTKEQLGGFYLIDVPDMETALEWAARNPAASTGAVEVRRVVQRGG